MKIVYLDTCDSTNSYVGLRARELSDMTLVVSRIQEAGRGQRGNSWEAKPGLNFTGTLLHRPAMHLTRNGITNPSLPELQFAISEAVALAIADTLRTYGLEPSLKWPNDVYVGDKKICGILIEHALIGSTVEHSRIGIGVNVNQTEFDSDAPNPTSIALETGNAESLQRFITRIYEALAKRLDSLYSGPASTVRGEPFSPDLHKEYLSLLWRSDGRPHKFRLRKPEEKPFNGTIMTVLPDGPLLLRLDDGSEMTYYFREIEFMLQ